MAGLRKPTFDRNFTNKFKSENVIYNSAGTSMLEFQNCGAHRASWRKHAIQ